MKIRVPHGWLAVSLLSGLFLAGAGQAHAQIRNNNYKQLNSQFSTGAATGVFLEPDQVMGTAMSSPDGGGSSFVNRLSSSFSSQINTGFSETLPGLNQHLNNSRATLPSNTFDTTYSSLNGQMSGSPLWKSNFPMGRNFTIKMAPTKDSRQPLMSENMQRNSSLNDYSAYDHWKSPKTAPDKFTDSFVFHTTDNSKQLQQVGQELSMQDINRFQFQGSFSGEPGLPITHAAGESDQVVATNGQLLHSPKLFDFSPNASNTVPSGGAVAPRVITSEGSRPYVPTKKSSFGLGSTITRTALHPVQSSSTNTTASQSSSESSQSGTGFNRGEIPKNEAMLPQGKYEYTTPTGSKLPVELDAPEVIIEKEN